MRHSIHLLSELIAGRRATVVGVGNPLRGDDAVGPAVAARLARDFPGQVIDAGSVPENFVGPILGSNPDLVVFVDAAELGEAPGRWRVHPLDALRSRALSTHIGTLRPLGQLLEDRGIEVWVVGIEPAQLELGAPMSPELEMAAGRLASVLACAMKSDARRVRHA